MRAKITRELEEAGFNVTQCPNYYDLEVQNGVSPMNFIQMLTQGRRADFQKNYDVVFVFINVKGYAQKNTERLSWSCGHSMEMPWYNEEVPVVTVSLNYTNHLIDYANAHTFINAYRTTKMCTRWWKRSSARAPLPALRRRPFSAAGGTPAFKEERT